MVKTLIDSFRYPAAGPGHDVGSLCREVKAARRKVAMGRKVVSCRYDATPNEWTRHDAGRGRATRRRIQAEHVISSAPDA